MIIALILILIAFFLAYRYIQKIKSQLSFENQWHRLLNSLA